MADGTVLAVAIVVGLVYGWPWWSLLVLVFLFLLSLGANARRG